MKIDITTKDNKSGKYPHRVNIEYVTAGYTFICAGNAIYEVEKKVNEIIKKLNRWDKA